jgi:single-stranded DNA-binding protein
MKYCPYERMDREINQQMFSMKYFAEIIAKFCTRGDVVLVSGRYCVDKYEKDGMQKTINYINVESVEFLRASGANTCSGFKKFKQENITNSFDSMGEEMPSVESLDW